MIQSCFLEKDKTTGSPAVKETKICKRRYNVSLQGSSQFTEGKTPNSAQEKYSANLWYMLLF